MAPEVVFNVRTATGSDRQAAEQLLKSAELPLDGVRDRLPSGYAVAEAGGRLVGIAGVEVWGDHGLLRSVAIDSTWRRRGVGEALVRDRLEYARNRGLKAVYLLTDTAPDYFARFGFQPVGRASVPADVQQSAEFKGACPEGCGVMMLPLPDGDLREQVRARYAQAALRVAAEQPGSGSAPAGTTCGCGAARSCCDGGVSVRKSNPVSSGIYLRAQEAELPEKAVVASMGCGNPTALADLKPGQVVLDLGSGGGIDVFLAARKVGPEGRAYGLDMTDEMLALARENQKKAGVDNVEFLKGTIEAIPLPDHTVDVVISNCVLNLSVDKPRALAEAFRVLKPGGLFAVSDIVVRGPVPEALRKNVELWIGCIAGALEENEYQRLLTEAGFQEVELQPTRIYGIADARDFLKNASPAIEEMARSVDGKFVSAFVRARKPMSA